MDIYRKSAQTANTAAAKETAGNTLLALNDKLFAQLDNLTSKNLKGEDLKNEIDRTDAIVDVAKTIIGNAELCLRAQIAKDEKLGAYAELPRMING